VYNLKAPAKCQAIQLFLPYVIHMPVGGDDDLLGSDVSELPELIFGFERFVLGNLLQDAEHELIVFFDIVNEDDLLISVAVPILGLILLVQAAVLC